MSDPATNRSNPATELRVTLLANGYVPVPITAGTKACTLPKWSQMKVTEEVIQGWEERDDPGIGIRGDGLAPVDIDIKDAALSAEVEKLAREMLGDDAPRRIGFPPKQLLLYRTAVAEKLSKTMTAKFVLPDTTEAQVEILSGSGCYFVVYGIHPDTKQAYTWPDGCDPWDTPFGSLPVVTPGQLEEFREAAEALIRKAGGKPKKAKAEEKPTSSGKPKGSMRGVADTDTFARKVNAEALNDADAWVTAIFPKARKSSNGAWRVKPWVVGQQTEEDLSIHPSGITNFGTEEKMTAIDVVMKWLPKSTWQEAAFWICEQLGRDPQELGWKNPKPKPAQSHRADDDPLAGFDITEDGIALAFAAKHQHELRYCTNTGAWFRWIGSHWSRDNRHVAASWVRDVCREVGRTEKDSVKATLGKKATAAAVEGFARIDQRLVVTHDIWNANPWVLGTPGGTVDLRTGQLRASRQGDFISKITAVAPAETADCPIWLRFLDEATAGDKALQDFLQRFMGYCLTGDTSEQSLIFIHGSGQNGKGVFLRAMRGILADYAKTAAMDTFMHSQVDRHSTDIAMLNGARMVSASETEEGRSWSEVRLKTLTGEDSVSARFMRQDAFEFVPQFKLVFIGNHKPKLRNPGVAEERRFNIVPFIHKPAVRDNRLDAKLRAEWPGILRWMIDGALAWQESGLGRPEAVAKATDTYFGDEDKIGQWIEDWCDVGPNYRQSSAALFGSWSAYAERNGGYVGDAKRLKDALETRGFGYAKVWEKFWTNQEEVSKQVRVFKGLRLKPASQMAD